MKFLGWLRKGEEDLTLVAAVDEIMLDPLRRDSFIQLIEEQNCEFIHQDRLPEFLGNRTSYIQPALQIKTEMHRKFKRSEDDLGGHLKKQRISAYQKLLSNSLGEHNETVKALDTTICLKGNRSISYNTVVTPQSLLINIVKGEAVLYVKTKSLETYNNFPVQKGSIITLPRNDVTFYFV